MAINSPRIVAGPTKPRGHIPDQIVTTHPVDPGESYLELVDGLRVITTVGPPNREGQVYFHPQQDGENRWATMYIGVDIDSTLTWVPAFTGDFASTYTGFPFDPIYDG